MEVTTLSESASDPVSVSFAAVCSFRRAMFSDCFIVPCPPGPPLAAGKQNTDAYCPAHPGDLLIEVDDRLYPAERLYFDENHGRDCLCSEAEWVVSVLREQVDVRFFNQRDTSRNVLTSAPVLMSAAVSPCTCKLCRAVSKMIDRTGLYEQAVLEVRGVCDRLTEPAVPTSTGAAPPARCASRHRRAYTSLPDLTDDE